MTTWVCLITSKALITYDHVRWHVQHIRIFRQNHWTHVIRDISLIALTIALWCQGFRDFTCLPDFSVHAQWIFPPTRSCCTMLAEQLQRNAHSHHRGDRHVVRISRGCVQSVLLHLPSQWQQAVFRWARYLTRNDNPTITPIYTSWRMCRTHKVFGNLWGNPWLPRLVTFRNPWPQQARW